MQRSEKGQFVKVAVKNRFWDKVSKTELCWYWRGWKASNGYGLIKISGRCLLAHRVVLELNGVEVPKDKVVMHLCDNPACVNPSHLKIGTQSDNIKDMFQKGRQPDLSGVHAGEKNPAAKLNQKDVDYIRLQYCPRVITRKMLAAKFNVSKPLIDKILGNRLWITQIN